MEKRQGTILLVDDDAAYRTMLKANLARAGYRVEVVTDGDEVLPFLGQHEVDLILLNKTGNNKSLTAKKLGVSRQTLLNKINGYGLLFHFFPDMSLRLFAIVSR